MIIQKFARFILCLLTISNLSVHAAKAQSWDAISRKNNVAIIGSRRPEVWTLQPFRRQRVIELRKSPSSAPALSRDGKLVAYGFGDSTIEIFETRTGKLWKRLGQPQQFQAKYDISTDRFRVNTITFAPNGKWLATGNSKGLFVWDVYNGKLLFSRRFPESIGGGQGTDLIEFSPNSHLIAVSGGHMSSICLFDIKRKRFGVQYQTHSDDGKALAMRFSPNGRYLLVSSYWSVSASSYDQVHVFNVRSGRVKWKWANNFPGISTVEYAKFLKLATWSKDGKRVAVGSEVQLQIHNARTGTLLFERKFNEDRFTTFQQQRQYHPQLNVR